MSTDEISWSAPEFIHYPKSRAWFVVLLAAGLGLVVFFLLQRDFLTAVLFILLFSIVFYFSRVKPRIFHFKLNGHGLRLNEQRLPYHQIKSFWIVYEPPHIKTLNFETTAHFNRFLTVQLANEDPVKIRSFLLEYLPEDLDRSEQIPDKIARALKF